METTLKQIEEITKMVIQQLEKAPEPGAQAAVRPGIFSSMDDAIEAAYKAQREYFEYCLQDRKKFVDAIRDYMRPKVEEMARRGVEETGMGNYPHKVLKNHLVLDKTPGIEDLQSGVFTGDRGLTLLEHAPFGVIGAITPSTNPTETIMCNSIGMLAAGNSVVFSPHPGAKSISIDTVVWINEALRAVGAPENLVVTVDKPSMEAVNRMMTHPLVNMLCATGGPGVVKAVLSSGKKAIGAGAGNPPVVVDETADIEKAAKDIVDGASFDNNLPCIAEKECIVVDQVADYLIFQMQKHGAYLIEDRETITRLRDLVVTETGAPNKAYIGKDAHVILKDIGIEAGEDIRLIICETPGNHVFAEEELMMPVLPIIRVANVQDAMNLGIKLEHGLRHTGMIHSKNIDVLTEFARRIQTTIFVKNGPSYAGIGVGGEGYTTFTIAGPTGEGLTSASSFTRKRRCVLVDGFAIR
jgi:propionaldehyde dehydrogenase